MPADDFRLAWLGHTEQELAAERAAALRRIAGTLETLLSDLATLRARFEMACPRDRAALRERYEGVRERAQEYRWYLRVQREANGLRRHDDVDAAYPVPSRLP